VIPLLLKEKLHLLEVVVSLCDLLMKPTDGISQLMGHEPAGEMREATWWTMNRSVGAWSGRSDAVASSEIVWYSDCGADGLLPVTMTPSSSLFSWISSSLPLPNTTTSGVVKILCWDWDE
jgi:hypothetical protein